MAGTDSIIQKYHPDFNSLRFIYGDMSGLFINRVEMLEYPRPLPHNFIYMQGSGLKKEPPGLPKVRKISACTISNRKKFKTLYV